MLKRDFGILTGTDGTGATVMQRKSVDMPFAKLGEVYDSCRGTRE